MAVVYFDIQYLCGGTRGYIIKEVAVASVEKNNVFHCFVKSPNNIKLCEKNILTNNWVKNNHNGLSLSMKGKKLGM